MDSVDRDFDTVPNLHDMFSPRTPHVTKTAEEAAYFRGLKPETAMMHSAYKPELSEGSLKVPIFMTSTFCFPNAERGEQFFKYVSRLAGN